MKNRLFAIVWLFFSLNGFSQKGLPFKLYLIDNDSFEIGIINAIGGFRRIDYTESNDTLIINVKTSYLFYKSVENKFKLPDNIFYVKINNDLYFKHYDVNKKRWVLVTRPKKSLKFN